MLFFPIVALLLSTCSTGSAIPRDLGPRAIAIPYGLSSEQILDRIRTVLANPAYKQFHPLIINGQHQTIAPTNALVIPGEFEVVIKDLTILCPHPKDLPIKLEPFAKAGLVNVSLLDAPRKSYTVTFCPEDDPRHVLPTIREKLAEKQAGHVEFVFVGHEGLAINIPREEPLIVPSNIHVLLENMTVIIRAPNFVLVHEDGDITFRNSTVQAVGLDAAEIEELRGNAVWEEGDEQIAWPASSERNETHG